MLEGPAHPHEPPEQAPTPLQQPPGPQVHFEEETPPLHPEEPQDDLHRHHAPDPTTPYRHENEETPQVQDTGGTAVQEDCCEEEEVPQQEFECRDLE
eukprot:5064232-Pyramimonas_sp.AAC.1